MRDATTISLISLLALSCVCCASIAFYIIWSAAGIRCQENFLDAARIVNFCQQERDRDASFAHRARPQECTGRGWRFRAVILIEICILSRSALCVLNNISARHEIVAFSLKGSEAAHALSKSCTRVPQKL